MKKRILYSLSFALLLIPNISGMAQFFHERGLPPRQTSAINLEDDIHDGRTMVMLTPQFLLVDQIRIEIDRRLLHRHWISFAPHYVQNHTEFQTHWGFGLATTYKWFMGEESPVYIGGGLQFTRHNLENSALDDLTQLTDLLYSTNIMQYGVNMVFGRYIRLFPHVYGDIYGGLGYRFSQTTTSDGVPHAFRNRVFDLGYEGWILVVGIRFGIML
jgi:hypothetical protein